MPCPVTLNFHHLYYFWTVAHEGTVLRAAERLGVSQPTVSTQLQALERSLRVRLFERRGRNLVLTESGRLTLSYADEIFARGRELQEALQGAPIGSPLRFSVGVSDSLAKLVVYQLLAPLFASALPVQLICREASIDVLLGELALHRLDMVLTDAPIGTDRALRAYNHFLGECSLEVFGTNALAEALSPEIGFPRNLHGKPFLLPLQHSVLRRALDAWLENEGIAVDTISSSRWNVMIG